MREEEGQRGWADEGRSAREVEDRLCEAEQVGDVGEESCVAGYAVKDGRVFVLHFALDDAFAESSVALGGRDRGAEIVKRAEAGGSQAEGREDFAVAEGVERFAGDDFDGFAEEDEAGVGVLSALAGFGFERELQGGAEERVGGGAGAEKLDVAGQAGTVGEEHAEGDALFAAAWLHADDEAGEDVAEAGVEIELAARVEEHGGGGGGDDFSEAGEIEDGGWLDGGRSSFVGEAADRFHGDDVAMMQNAEGCAGEGAVLDGLLEQVAG